MNRTFRASLAVLAGTFFAVDPAAGQASKPFNAQELTSRTLHRRAVESAIWGMPLVSVDAMREAFFRDAGAKYNDIVYWSQPADWRLQFTTPNASTRYVYFNFNLKDGPVVLDIPAAVGAGLFGSVLDAWQVPLADVGPAGEDAGKGGKYVFLPPGYDQVVPAGHVAVRSETVNGYALFRVIPESSTEADVAKAIDLVKKMSLYPLAQASNPPAQRHIDMAGKLMDGVVAFDETFYDRLARMVNEEPVMARDLVALSQLRSLGLEKGRPFSPPTTLVPILRQGASEAHEGFMLGVRGGEAWWPGTQWKLPENKGPKTGFTYLKDTSFFLDERGLIYFLAFATPKKLGAATFYTVGANDRDGKALQGEKTYRLHVPPNVPAKQYWAVTVYDLDTACLIRDLARPGLDSYDKAMRRNADGSVDIYFGPQAPAGQEANWVPTKAGRPWFTLFRFYGPDKALFEKTWSLPDFEPVVR
ncbi:DUF1254 domain-containing protein [Variovorax sp. J31P207]|uniref:DUF1254 domain-containing protein n=1 Tax=Variovorax sp. J31P207 TaxID=3053510 RepID=UPI0025768244|nr:DUF1254 domain-containing protein [Variovorax sp. J31P207]MDM0072531.1 DUF1254 domain-containing protein [Variovorax sp. J31P207]